MNPLLKWIMKAYALGSSFTFSILFLETDLYADMVLLEKRDFPKSEVLLFT